MVTTRVACKVKSNTRGPLFYLSSPSELSTNRHKVVNSVIVWISIVNSYGLQSEAKSPGTLFYHDRWPQWQGQGFSSPAARRSAPGTRRQRRTVQRTHERSTFIIWHCKEKKKGTSSTSALIFSLMPRAGNWKLSKWLRVLDNSSGGMSGAGNLQLSKWLRILDSSSGERSIK